MTTWIFLKNNLPLLGIKVLEHLILAVSATLIATLIAIPIGVLILKHERLNKIILAIMNVFQTIPSLALLAFFIPILGIGFKPTIVTLIVYALLPIARNTYTGLRAVPPGNREAAQTLGFTAWQQLRIIELPLAQPMIIAGIRTATAMTVGITTIAAFVGAGGLGDFIVQGLALNDSRLILLGAIPTALLALILDFILAKADILLSARQRQTMKHRKLKLALSGVIAAIILIFPIKNWVSQSLEHRSNTVVIGTKDFSEQYILGEMMSQLIAAKTTLHIKKVFNLGATPIMQNALLKGSIDLYPEYTGTAYQVVLNQQQLRSADDTYQFVKQAYKKEFDLVWLNSFGFNNSETLAISENFAKEHHIKTLEDLVSIAPQLSVAAPAEFLKRADGLPGLSHTYGLQFKNIRQMQPDLMYPAIKSKSVDAILAFTTDTRLASDHLLALEDNKHFYPPYYAAPVIRGAVLKSHPELAAILNLLSERIDEPTMQHLNYLLSIEHQTPEQVAHDFLVKKGLVQK